MLDYKQELQTLETAINELSTRARALRAEFQQVCLHPNVAHTEKYHSGGYDYQASTHHRYTCQDCGLFEFSIEQHNTGFE